MHRKIQIRNEITTFMSQKFSIKENRYNDKVKKISENTVMLHMSMDSWLFCHFKTIF